MAIRKIEIGEELRTGRVGQPDTEIHEKGCAVSVIGLTAGRIGVSDALGSVQKRVIKRELEVGRVSCPLGDSCELTVVTPTSDDALPSEAIFKCPRGEEGCDTRVEGVAGNANRQATHAQVSAAESIRQLGAGK